jgi:hypothetical protein
MIEDVCCPPVRFRAPIPKDSPENNRRKVVNPLRQFGQLPIGQIEFNPRSRDSLTKLLRGLQFIYTTPAVRAEVFDILAERAARQADPRNGRPGLDLWAVLVMGTLRLNLNWDFDLLLNQVNYHSLIRQMLGHGPYDLTGQYKRQTLQDNLQLLTPEVLDRINAVVVRAGHTSLKKKAAPRLMAAAIPAWWKRRCIIPPASICCGTPCARRWS